MRLDRFNNAHFDRGAPLLKEFLWWIVKAVFFAPWIPVPSVLKVVLLRIFGAKVGLGVVIRSRVNITFPWRLEIADHVWIGEEVIILNLARVSIGSHVCISQRAFLCTGSHKFTSEAFDLLTRPITIDRECWIAANVFIGPGVTLRTGTVCSASSVVLRDAGPNQVLVGNPAIPRGGTHCKIET